MNDTESKLENKGVVLDDSEEEAAAKSNELPSFYGESTVKLKSTTP